MISTCTYADDGTQYELVPSDSHSHMQEVRGNLVAWADRNKMEINVKKTKEMWIGFRKTQQSSAPSQVSIGNEVLERVEVFTLLGVHVQRDLEWNAHIDDIVARANKRLYYLRVCRKANLPTEVGLATYITKIRLVLEHNSHISGGLPKYLADDLQRIQNRSMDILGLSRDALDPLDVRRDKHNVHAFNSILEADDQPCKRFINEIMHSYLLRAQRVGVLVPHTNRTRDSFIQRGARLHKAE